MIARLATRYLVCLALAGCLEAPPDAEPPALMHSLEFFGHSYQDPGIDRVWIPAERPSPVGRLGRNDFTVELWLKLDASALRDTGGCPESWWQGTILLDREFFTAPQNGSIGLSLHRTADLTGVAAGFTVIDAPGVDVCGSIEVGDGAWHHVAMTRDPDHLISIWVDGLLDAEVAGPAGDGSFADDLVGEELNDRFMVLGGPKHASDEQPGFTGFIDDVRLSSSNLYDKSFDPPLPPLAVDPEKTLALWNFDEGEGDSSEQRAGDGAADADLRVGGEPPGPIWSNDVPGP